MRPRYDVNARWDDPWERREEHRTAARCRADLRIKLTVEDKHLRGVLTGPGLVNNVSLTGACVLTKHRVTPGQIVMADMPADCCPEHMGLPKAFVGPVEVVRVQAVDERKSLVGLRFGEPLSQNIEFAVFIDYLRTIALLKSA